MLCPDRGTPGTFECFVSLKSYLLDQYQVSQTGLGSHQSAACSLRLFERRSANTPDITGRYILTIDATAGASEMFERFDLAEAKKTYMTAAATTGGSKRVKELIGRG